MTIHYISDDAVERIGKGLIDATLPRVEWTHATTPPGRRGLACAVRALFQEPIMTIHYISDDAVERIGKGLIDATLPRVEWTHAAHFAAALWLLRHRPDAVETLPSLIRRYNEVAGDGNSETSGYHETITQASLRAARHVLLSHDGLPLHEVLDHLMASPFGRSDWLLAYWSRDRLFSVEARRVWCEPDLQPLPF